MMVETKKNMEEKRDHLGKYWWVALVLFTLLSQGIMAFASCRYNRCGFPLDDAWIHQTYARNLVAMGDFYYREGVVSAGSTAPLWTFLLAIGYLIKQPFIWTYILGGALLAGVGILGELIYRCVSGRREAMPWMGLFLIGEWHLLWAAGSGMETILYVFLEFLLIYLLLFPEPKWLLMALVMGALVWTRPDGIAWLGPVALVAFFNPKYRLSRNSWFAFIPVFSLILALYVVFNHHLGGTWLPNTFNAKQAEYSTLLQEALISRYLRLIVMPWVGGAIFPGARFSLFVFRCGCLDHKCSQTGTVSCRQSPGVDLGNDFVGVGLCHDLCFAAAGDLPAREISYAGNAGVLPGWVGGVCAFYQRKINLQSGRMAVIEGCVVFRDIGLGGIYHFGRASLL
ncbi:MAG: hypothetical protein HPY76_10295 [Anaerolineae bacterium]|nr:hypothetical protein [Anaerolineae bacterium]